MRLTAAPGRRSRRWSRPWRAPRSPPHGRPRRYRCPTRSRSPRAPANRSGWPRAISRAPKASGGGREARTSRSSPARRPTPGPSGASSPLFRTMVTGRPSRCRRSARASFRSPGLPVEQRLDSLEAAVECASNANPFAGLGDDLPFGRENTYRFGLSFSQTLFSGGRVSGQTQAANANVRSADIGLTAARAQLLLDVTKAYYDAALGDRLVAIAEATLRQADTTLSQSQLAREVGTQSEFDLLRARVTRDNQRPVVIQRQASRDLAHYALKNLLNLPLDEPIALTTELVDTTMVRTARLAELVQTAADTSTDGARAGAAGRRDGHITGRVAARGPGAALATGVAHLGLRRAGVSERRLAVRDQLPLRLGRGGRAPDSALHRRTSQRRRGGRARRTGAGPASAAADSRARPARRAEHAAAAPGRDRGVGGQRGHRGAGGPGLRDRRGSLPRRHLDPDGAKRPAHPAGAGAGQPGASGARPPGGTDAPRAPARAPARHRDRNADHGRGGGAHGDGTGARDGDTQPAPYQAPGATTPGVLTSTTQTGAGRP